MRVYCGSIFLIQKTGVQTTISSEQAVIGVPELDKALPPELLQTADDFPKRLIGILGRDFLSHVRMIYDGSRGIIEVTLNLDSFPRISQ